MHKHLRTSHVNMSQGLQCHYIPRQTVFFHYEGTPKTQERHVQMYSMPLSKKTADIIHNELIKPGTNTGNKATKKTQLVLMPSDSHQDQ